MTPLALLVHQMIGIGLNLTLIKIGQIESKGARLKSIRNKTLINHADIVIVKFGEKYRQWNAAFDAGYSIAMNKPLITIHPPEFSHALKEIDAASLAVTDTPEKVIDILLYVTNGTLR